VISDDEDLKTAKTYAEMKQDKPFKTTLLNRETLQQIRREQDSDKDNQSITWQEIDTYKKAVNSSRGVPDDVQETI
jgi:hypothetical protein